MAKYVTEVEAITFEELVEYGKANTANIVNDMPWSFTYQGEPITHENDQCYLVPTSAGTRSFTPDDMLVTTAGNFLIPMPKEMFNTIYSLVPVNATITDLEDALP